MRRPVAAWLTSILPAAALPFLVWGLQGLGLLGHSAVNNMDRLVFLMPVALLPGIGASLLWERRWTLRTAVVAAGFLAYVAASVASVLLFSQPAPDCVVGQACP